MKFVNILQGTNLGGMEQASLRLMVELQNQGHSCDVISLNPVGSLGPLLAKHEIQVTGLPYLGKGGWRSIFMIWRTLRAVQADALLMTGHHLLSMLLLGGLCKGKRLLAIHFHHTGVKPPWQWRIIYRVACSRFQFITFPSDFVRTEAEVLYPPVKTLSRTVRNPISIPQIPSTEDKAKARIALGLPHDALIIGNAGWLIPRKRFDVFLHVAQKVSEKIPNALFLIAGDGDDRLCLEALAKELGISERVVWLGWQKDLTSFFHSLDVMLFNSDWDAMGLTPLEAMSYGVPLVASVEQGGLGEIVTSEEYGCLLSTHDIDELANKIIYFLLNPDVARRVAMAGRERVAEVSNSEKITEETLSLLRGCNDV